MQYLPIVVSVLSLIVAFVTLYNTHLRHPDIHPHLGPLIKLYYPSDGGFAIYIPTTFINSAPRLGTVLRAAVVLHQKNRTQGLYFMQWGSFSQFDPATGNWVYENICHALPVEGKSSVTKLIWFNWQPSSQPKLIISSGQYVLTFLYWVDGQEQPKTDSHEVHVSSELLEELESYRSRSQSTTVEIALDERLARNRLIRADELSKLVKT